MLRVAPVLRVLDVIQPVSAGIAHVASARVTLESNFARRFALYWRRAAELSQQSTDLISFLLKPTAVVAFVLGCWRFCADLGWTQNFMISGGLFSHWQVWIAVGIAISAASSHLQDQSR